MPRLRDASGTMPTRAGRGRMARPLEERRSACLSSWARPEQTRGSAGSHLSEIIEGRLIAGDSEYDPTEDEPVLAIDVLGPYAAVYRFSADAGGAWFAGCTLAQRPTMAPGRILGRVPPTATARSCRGGRRGEH